jgi:hypothetical protein
MKERDVIAARLLAALAVPFIMSACSDGVPASPAAMRAGDAPKQILDKASADTATAARQAAERTDKAE